MAKASGGKSATNLLRISGILFGTGGSLHLLRYLTKDEFVLAKFHLTYLGSLIIGLILVALSLACFYNSKK